MMSQRRITDAGIAQTRSFNVVVDFRQEFPRYYIWEQLTLTLTPQL